ncbi:MAG: hypothetical protein CO090_02945 [Acidobacteria bacterium CG_4_9_14_3_um_filter_49_7]|nr:MAG: hypothetical protein CO090_02945 [Acidobacteria bacterium CG_4_9_14_3_um_filter_49_7]
MNGIDDEVNDYLLNETRVSRNCQIPWLDINAQPDVAVQQVLFEQLMYTVQQGIQVNGFELRFGDPGQVSVGVDKG